MKSLPVERGHSAPLGASVQPGGVSFSVFSRTATLVELLLFDHECDPVPSRVIPLHPDRHRTYHYWHALVPGLRAGQLYGLRAHGPHAPEQGLRFDPGKVLLDPYARAVAVPAGYSRKAAMEPGDNTATAMKGVVADLASYDWEGDSPLCRAHAETLIYELHVRGFTRHPSSGVAPNKAGTYAGLIEKIPYLQDLGVSAVELLPVFHFDVQDAPQGRSNYWGYAPIAWFAPHQAYASSPDPLAVLDEFRDMVKALHRAGIEVILDVVFNHSAEGNHEGPTLSLRGLDNSAYYMLERDRSRYVNYSGTGNTLDANQPVVRRLILDSLRFWVEHMHVDGFRFDLASVLSRGDSGQLLPNPPLLWDIESDPVLAGTRLIAEAWDAAGLYQVGSFIGDAWQEWNGRFRDDVRRFLRGDDGTVGRLADRLLGSPDLYRHENREPEQSVNFITCHDGFTLEDLVSYQHKHNEANGEQNRDGCNDNASWNCGVEGPTEDPAIAALRARQARNFLGLLLLAAGTPMLTMGDEVRRTQRGNNNAYCQDSEISWFDWTLLDRNRDLHRYVREWIAFRRRRRDRIGEPDRRTLGRMLEIARIDWHGVRAEQPDWSATSHSLAVTFTGTRGPWRIHVLVNAYHEPLRFALPGGEQNERGWLRWVDTALASPEDIVAWEKAPAVRGPSYLVQPRSLVCLVEPQAASAHP